MKFHIFDVVKCGQKEKEDVEREGGGEGGDNKRRQQNMSFRCVHALSGNVVRTLSYRIIVRLQLNSLSRIVIIVHTPPPVLRSASIRTF